MTIAAALILLDAQRTDSPWQRGDAFRVNLRARTASADAPAGATPIAVDVAHEAGRLSADARRSHVRGERIVGRRPLASTAFIDGEPFRCSYVRDGDDLYVMRGGATEKFGLPKLDAASFAADALSDGRGTAPMPGQIIALFVKAGDTVRRDQPILVLEAMKMEHTIAAPIDGTLERLALTVGDRVVEGTELFQIR